MNDKRGAAVGSISSMIAGGFVGWVVSEACNSLFPKLAAPLSEHPMETIAISATASLLGFAIGWFLRGRSQHMSISEKRYVRERAREEAKEAFKKARRSFLELDPELRAMMLAALEKGGAYCSGDDWRFSRLPDDTFISQFVETRYIDGDVAKITALPLLKDFSEQVPDAFDGVSKTLERHARNKGDRVVARFSTLSSPDWWWYR